MSDTIEATVQISRLGDTANQFTTVQAILDLLPTHMRVTLSTGVGEALVVAGSAEPRTSQRTYPWARKDASGKWIGWYIWYDDEWVLAPSIPIGSILFMSTVSLGNLPAGFALCNGDNGTRDLTGVADFWSPAYVSTVTDYDYAPLQYMGIGNA